MTPRTSPIRVILADDHVMVRSALTTLIDNEPDLLVVGECGRGDEAVEMVAALTPDVAVLDVDMPVLDGLAACAAITARTPSCRCLVLTALNKPGVLQQAMRSGARGYIVKYAPTEELLQAIRAVASGRRAVDAFLAVAALASQDVAVTARELQVVRLVANGMADREIGRRLHLSPGTVRNYLSNAMIKVDAHNRVDLVRIGVRDGWLYPGQ